MPGGIPLHAPVQDSRTRLIGMAFSCPEKRLSISDNILESKDPYRKEKLAAAIFGAILLIVLLVLTVLLLFD